MATFRKDKNEDEEGDGMDIFRKLDKSIILQEVRYFNSNQVDAKKCILILSKTLLMVNQGVQFTTEEATNIFFAITRLFQSKDVMLRRVVYLSIKELSSLAQNVFIVSSSLIKDMTDKEDLIRAAAIRTLRSITDNSMLQGVERYMKQAILDKNPAVSSAALVSALHFSASAPDLDQRWLNEAQIAVTSNNIMVTYHALGVISASKHNDRLFMSKLVNKLLQRPIQSPYTVCLVIRHAAKLAENETEHSESYLEFIESCLYHRSEIVIYEAAHAVVSLSKNIRDLTQAISALQIFCVSSRASTRLAGARTLAQVTAKHPKAVIVCTVDLENLFCDSNRSIATLAITTLLTNCTECSIERLIKKISRFFEITDEFNIVVVGAIKNLCFKYPRKQQFLVSLLSDMLRHESDEEHKMAIANSIISLIEENPDAKEIGLSHLCEFIEDFHQETLAVRVLHVIGREGPKVRQPSRFIRFIYNRILLNSEPVRAAAVSAVAQFGAACADLLPSIKMILDRCQTDDDNEVRDRATFYSAIFNSGDQELINNYITNVPIYDFVLLEETLQNHLKTHPDQTFKMDTVPTVNDIKKLRDKLAQTEPFQVNIVSLEEQYANQLKVIPYIKKLGPVFKTCEPIELTEPETEYQVKCIKHIYAKHLILQFECLNTLFSHLLKEVHICLDMVPEYNLICEVPCESLTYEKKGNIFCVLEFPTSPLNSIVRLGAALEFSVYDCDSITGRPYPGGYTDTYRLEPIEIGCSEQFKIQPASADWEVSWESAESQKQVMNTFVMNNYDVAKVSKAMCKHLGLPESSVKGDTIKKICGLGTWRTGIPVIFSARMVPSLSGVTMLLTVRSPNEAVATLLLAAIE